MFLLLMEPRCLDLAYCLLLEPKLPQPVRCQLLRIIYALLRTSAVSARHKGRLHLQVSFQLFFFLCDMSLPSISTVPVGRDQLLSISTKSHRHI
jgi:hypothetical protein